MDRGPTLRFVQSLHDRYGAPGAGIEATTITKRDTDWDVLFPLSSFLETYKFELPTVDFSWPEMGMKVKELGWSEGVRRLEIHLDFVSLAGPFSAKYLHPPSPHRMINVQGVPKECFADALQTGLVWPTLAFDAEVVDWSYEFAPPKGYRRHHLKIATSVDTPTVDLELDIRAEKGEKLKFEWSAIGGYLFTLYPYDLADPLPPCCIEDEVGWGFG